MWGVGGTLHDKVEDITRTEGEEYELFQEGRNEVRRTCLLVCAVQILGNGTYNIYCPHIFSPSLSTLDLLL
jgi:hypothetical protein